MIRVLTFLFVVTLVQCKSNKYEQLEFQEKRIWLIKTHHGIKEYRRYSKLFREKTANLLEVYINQKNGLVDSVKQYKNNKLYVEYFYISDSTFHTIDYNLNGLKAEGKSSMRYYYKENNSAIYFVNYQRIGLWKSKPNDSVRIVYKFGPYCDFYHFDNKDKEILFPYELSEIKYFENNKLVMDKSRFIKFNIPDTLKLGEDYLGSVELVEGRYGKNNLSNLIWSLSDTLRNDITRSCNIELYGRREEKSNKLTIRLKTNKFGKHSVQGKVISDVLVEDSSRLDTTYMRFELIPTFFYKEYQVVP